MYLFSWSNDIMWHLRLLFILQLAMKWFVFNESFSFNVKATQLPYCLFNANVLNGKLIFTFKKRKYRLGKTSTSIEHIQIHALNDEMNSFNISTVNQNREKKNGSLKEPQSEFIWNSNFSFWINIKILVIGVICMPFLSLKFLKIGCSCTLNTYLFNKNQNYNQIILCCEAHKLCVVAGRSTVNM